MKASNTYLFLSLLLLPLSLILIILRKCRLSNHELPPGSTGWPMVGETLDFKKANKSANPEHFISDRMSLYSPQVFKTSLFGEKMAVFCGPSGNKFLFTNEYKLVTSWWPKSMKIALNYPKTSKKTPTKQELTRKRKLLHEILKPEALRSYIQIMDSMARDHLAMEWIPLLQHDEIIKVYPLLKNYTFALACKIFLGIQDPDQVAKFGDEFAVLRAGYASVPINIPGTALNRSVKAGKIIREELMKIVRERKREMLEEREGESGSGSGSDLLSLMLQDSDENGRLMTEIEICNQIIGSLIASHHTTSTAISFVIKYLAELPHIYHEVYKEQVEIAWSKSPDELLEWDDIQKMKYSWNVACEAMRLAPPAQGSFREAIVDFTYQGFTIPKGWKTHWTTYSTHKDPKYFPNPENFDPSRFEGDGPIPYTFVPFGGGPRICPGKEYARLEILVFIHNVVTRFNFDKGFSQSHDNLPCNPTTIAVNGLPIRLRPLSTPTLLL